MNNRLEERAELARAMGWKQVFHQDGEHEWSVWHIPGQDGGYSAKPFPLDPFTDPADHIALEKWFLRNNSTRTIPVFWNHHISQWQYPLSDRNIFSDTLMEARALAILAAIRAKS